MYLSVGVAFFALWGTASATSFYADVNMAGITGHLEFNSLQQTVSVNITGTCGQTNISLHAFPVVYGAFLQPCTPTNIGDPLYEFSLNHTARTTVSVNVGELFELHTSLADISLVVHTCDRKACGNIRRQDGVALTWHAKFLTLVLGEAYFRQQEGEESLTILTDLVAISEEKSTVLNMTMYFSPTCDPSVSDPSVSRVNVSLGSFKVGSILKAVKSACKVPGAKIGRFALLRYKDQWICAEVIPLRVKYAEAPLSMNGVSGSINFKQVSPFDPTQISVDLKNLSSAVKYYHVHRFPVPQRRDPGEDLCSDNHIGGHWNPFSVNVSAPSYPKADNGTHDLYEVGDLSGKHGTLEGLNTFKSVFTDWNLQLFGRNSVIGRSVVLHKSDNSRLLCGNIGYDGEMVTAVAVFRDTVVGRVVFRQLKGNPYAELSVYSELSYSNASAPSTADHNWHVHEFPVSTESDSDREACLSTKGHFNPTRIVVDVDYRLQCQPLRPFLCEVGDLAGKHTPINLANQARSVRAKAFFIETTSALSGFSSILGKSLVIHGEGQTLTRIACANITVLRPSVGKTGQWFGSKRVVGELQVSQPLDLDPTSVNVSFTNLGSLCGGYHVHRLPVQRNSSEPCADASIKGHFNPFLINMTLSPAPGTGTVDKYEVGDLSGKHGMLTGKDMCIHQYLESNLPLSGSSSILGRSLVIHHNNGSRMQCANIEPQKAEDGEWVRAVASFRGSVRGSISMVQQVFPDGSYSDATVEVDIQSSETHETELQWYISSQFLPQDDPRCPTDDGMEPYNPHGIYRGPGYNSSCSQQSPLHCSVGDMAGKLGPATVGVRQLLTDANLPLTGDFTVVGRVLLMKSGPEVLACAPITHDGPVITLVFPTVTRFSRYEFRSAVARVLLEPLWKVNLLPEGLVEAPLGKCRKISFFVIGYQDKQKLESIRDHKDMGVFRPSSLCGSVSPLPGQALQVAAHHTFFLWLLAVGLLHRLQLGAMLDF